MNDNKETKGLLDANGNAIVSEKKKNPLEGVAKITSKFVDGELVKEITPLRDREEVRKEQEEDAKKFQETKEFLSGEFEITDESNFEIYLPQFDFKVQKDCLLFAYPVVNPTTNGIFMPDSAKEKLAGKIDGLPTLVIQVNKINEERVEIKPGDYVWIEPSAVKTVQTFNLYDEVAGRWVKVGYTPTYNVAGISQNPMLQHRKTVEARLQGLKESIDYIGTKENKQKAFDKIKSYVDLLKMGVTAFETNAKV